MAKRSTHRVDTSAYPCLLFGKTDGPEPGYCERLAQAPQKGMSARSLPQLDLKQLHYFLMVADHGSISAASVALGLAPATISESIAKLEKRLGVSIAIRGQRGFVLTEAGALLRQEARSLLGAANALASNIATRGVVAGQVTFALTPSPNVLISVPLSETVRCELPDVLLRITEGMSGDIVEWILNESVDFGLVYEMPSTAVYDSRFAYREELVFASAPDFIPDCLQASGTTMVSLETLDNLPMVMPSTRHHTSRLIEKILHRHGMRFNLISEIESHSQMLEMTARASAHTIVSRAASLAHVQRGDLVVFPIAGGDFYRNCHVVRKRSRPVTAASMAVEQRALAIMREMSTRYGLGLVF